MGARYRLMAMSPTIVHRLVLAALTVLVLAGCTETGTPSEDETSGGTGTVSGVVTLVGGPVSPNGQPALDHEPATNWPVTIRSADGRTFRTTSDGDGHFTFEVEPGTYTLKCLRVEKLVVAQDESVSAKCGVPVP